MRKALLYISMYIISFSLMLTGAELLLRVTGVAEPWSTLAENEPAMFEADPFLGWKAKPGKYKLAPFSNQGHDTHYTILNDGSRATADNKINSPYDLIFIGGSFTEGFAVSDEETFAWKLQDKFPSLRIGNFGVGGYGTYQSLLLLRDLYKQKMRPKIVIYGFMPFHEERNIANSGWRRVLNEFSRRGHSALPFCSMDENGILIEHEPIGYPLLPLREHLALVDFAAKFYFRFIDADESKRREDGFEISKKLITEMKHLAEKNGSFFFTALLGQPGRYESFFKTSDIGMIDCRLVLNEEFTVKGEGHPNEKAHTVWAEKIATFLKIQPVCRDMSLPECF
jgi:hypothetical protein